jgi:stage III sporulation protein AH
LDDKEEFAMNNKKQTIWLVSMLGLMVILSAYYLFTDEVNPIPAVTNEVNSSMSEIEMTGELVTNPAENEQVMQQLEAEMSGYDAITAMQMTRDSDFSRKLEELTSFISNAEMSEEQIEQAIQQQNQLMDLESKLVAFEEKMLGEFDNVVVTYDELKDHYTVNVHATEMQKSEAVSVIRTAIKDLNIAVHQISIKLLR